MNGRLSGADVVSRPHTSPARAGAWRTVVLTTLAVVAFAGNSILGRVALGGGAIDAASFCAIRLASGAVTLGLITMRSSSGVAWTGRAWVSAAVLFVYAVPFALAYIHLPAGTGALILFGCVQLTMMSAALRAGERPHALQWLGLIAASGGLVYLVFPGLTAPPIGPAALMAVAGIFWGLYSLRGRGSTQPVAENMASFVLATPMAALVVMATAASAHVTGRGLALASVSGAITSGLGYVVWYAALRTLSATRAAIVQLSVPVLAALGGVMFLGERISARLVVAAILVLGGVAVALVARDRHARTRA